MGFVCVYVIMFLRKEKKKHDFSNHAYGFVNCKILKRAGDLSREECSLDMHENLGSISSNT